MVKSQVYILFFFGGVCSANKQQELYIVVITFEFLSLQLVNWYLIDLIVLNVEVITKKERSEGLQYKRHPSGGCLDRSLCLMSLSCWAFDHRIFQLNGCWNQKKMEVLEYMIYIYIYRNRHLDFREKAIGMNSSSICWISCASCVLQLSFFGLPFIAFPTFEEG